MNKWLCFFNGSLGCGYVCSSWALRGVRHSHVHIVCHTYCGSHSAASSAAALLLSVFVLNLNIFLMLQFESLLSALWSSTVEMLSLHHHLFTVFITVPAAGWIWPHSSVAFRLWLGFTVWRDQSDPTSSSSVQTASVHLNQILQKISEYERGAAVPLCLLFFLMAISP